MVKRVKRSDHSIRKSTAESVMCLRSSQAIPAQSPIRKFLRVARPIENMSYTEVARGWVSFT